METPPPDVPLPERGHPLAADPVAALRRFRASDSETLAPLVAKAGRQNAQGGPRRRYASSHLPEERAAHPARGLRRQHVRVRFDPAHTTRRAERWLAHRRLCWDRRLCCVIGACAV